MDAECFTNQYGFERAFVLVAAGASKAKGLLLEQAGPEIRALGPVHRGIPSWASAFDDLWK